MSGSSHKHRIDMWLLMLGALNLYLLNAGNMVFMDPDEARCAVIAKNMLETGNWLVPRVPFEDSPYFDKPVLYFWMLSGTFHVLGVNEFAARLLSSVGAALVVGATFRLGQMILSRRAGLAAALMLMTSVMMVVGGRFVRMDMWLTAFVAWAVVFWGRVHFEQASPRNLFYGYACLAAAFLTKGLVGILLPCAAIGTYLLVYCDWEALRRSRVVSGTILLAALAGPWYAYMEWRFPGYSLDFFWRHHFLRASTGTFGRSQTFLFLPGAVLAGFVPWTFLFLAGIFRSLPLRSNSGWPRTRGCAIIFAWAAFGILPFAFSRTQLPVYVMPAFPAVALISGWCLDAVLIRNQRWELRLVVAGTIVVMALSLLSLAIINRYTCDLSPWATLFRRSLGFGVVLVAVIVLWKRDRINAITVTCLACATGAAIDAAWVEGPGLFRHFSSHRFVKPLAEQAADAQLVVIGPAPKYALPLYLKPQMSLVYVPHTIDFVQYVNHPKEIVALLTSTNLYELAKSQLKERMQTLDSRRDEYLVRIVPVSFAPGTTSQSTTKAAVP